MSKSSPELASYLDLADPNFSVRSGSVRDARQKSWFARTPYGVAVLRYQEVGELLRDQRLRQGSYKWPAHNQATGSFADWWLRMLLNRTGADHARLRRLVNPAFSPKLIATLQPRFEAIANELIDKFARRADVNSWPLSPSHMRPASSAPFSTFRMKIGETSPPLSAEWGSRSGSPITPTKKL